MIGKNISHYKILEKIGEGGMGVVYKAQDRKLDRTVALKFLPQSLTPTEEDRRRFIREAKAAAALNHPNICTIHQIEEYDGRRFIAMEYVEGQTLKDKLRQGPLSIGKAVHYALQIAEALAEAHEKGIVHRDIKPGNIMIDGKDRIKVMDFGLAKPTGSLDLTKTGSTLGTVPYMSPEQARGDEVDYQTDIWSLGVIMYEMISGHRPFKSEYEHALIYMILNEEPEPLNNYTRKISPEFAQIVEQTLKKNSGSRYVSIEKMVDDLKNYREQWKSNESGAVKDTSLIQVLQKPLVITSVAAAILAITIFGVWYFNHRANIEWAREEALPKIESHIMNYEFIEAYNLAEEIRNYIPGDPNLEQKISNSTVIINVETEPTGAEVYVKKYEEPESKWELRGVTPIEDIQMPIGIYRWKIEKEGYEPVLAAATNWSVDFGAEGSPFLPYDFKRKLDEEGMIPEGMVRVIGGETSHGEIGDFYIDKYEVTNRQFKEFVDAGGYQAREYWKHEFVKDGDILSWEEAMKEFVDQTGRSGPATWQAGSYPDGRGDYPVTGVSWYEAAAYAEFTGKILPTSHHWYLARGGNTPIIRFPGFIGGGALFAAHSNFRNNGVWPVGRSTGLNSYGTFDMAGNVREWCWNESDKGRIIRGGKWNDPVTMFGNLGQAPPFDRSPANGFRNAIYPDDEEIPDEVFKNITFGVEKNPYEEEPVSDEVFEVYKRQFAYDEKSLNAEVEWRNQNHDEWTHEKISFDAVYGNERISAHLFLPEDIEPPYQTVIYFPGAAAKFYPESENMVDYFGFRNYLEFIVKNGRAVIFPVYQGTFERDFNFDPFSRANRYSHRYTEYFTMLVKDFKRSLDYLEAREDIDMNKIAYYGLSWGAIYGGIIPAVEERIKTSVLLAGGFGDYGWLPAVNEINYTPRVTIPTLMINGRYDTVLPYETSIKPMYDLLGSEQKELKLYEADHVPPTNDIIKETLNWLDKHLGPAR